MNLYSTDELLGVVRNLKKPQTFLTRTFFPIVRRSEARQVHVDIEKKKRRLAPFVSPRSQGKIVETTPFATHTLEPAYIKDKRPYEPGEAIEHRSLGEALTGNLSAQEREDLWVANTLMDQEEMLDRRLEWMASQILRTGKVVITGEGFDDIEVDFQRDSNHTVALLTTARWGESNIRPLASLKTWSTLVQKNSGAFPNVVVMEPEAFDLFQLDTEVQRMLDTRRGSSAMLESVPGGRVEPQFRGVIGSYEIWTYQDWYVDPADGVEKQLLPNYSVIMGNPAAIEGRQHYGAIYDRKAGYQALRFFPKMWEEEDPSRVLLMAQSAPLLAPWRPDASFCATVR